MWYCFFGVEKHYLPGGTVQMPVNSRLRYARENLGLTLRQVEEATGIGLSSLSEYESGKRDPRLSQLKSLADLYQRSIEFFLSDEPLPREVVLWRDKPEDGNAAIIQAQFLRLCEQYHNLEVWCEDRRPCRLPQAEGSAATYSYADAEGLAQEVRRALSLGDRPAQTLLTTVEEECSVKVFHMSFDPSGVAACCVTDAFGAAVLLNAKNVRWRRNFDLAHELFHLLTWSVFRTGADGADAKPTETEEKFATCFASNLLLPTDSVRAALNEAIKDGKIAFGDMFDIARQFDTSVAALIWRMAFLKYISYDDAPAIIDRYDRVSAVWEGKRVHDDPPVRPARFRALAIRALRNGEFSLGRCAEYLGVTRREAGAFLEQDSQEDEEVNVTAA